MQHVTSTLKIVSIQHELALNIGTNLDLDIMLEHFMRVLQRRLSLTGVHTFICPSAYALGNAHKGLHYITIPKAQGSDNNANASIHEVFITSMAELKANSYHHIDNYTDDINQHFYSYAVGNLGWIILQRSGLPIDESVLNSLKPIFERLALSGIACQQHKSLLDEIKYREQVEQTLKQQAYLDSLTGLPNRKMLNQQLRKELSSANRHSTYGAVYYFDLDRFKNINDTLGHALGDKLLLKVAKKVRDMLRTEDVFARVGGDEFVILSPNLATNLDTAIEAAKHLAERILKEFEEPISLKHSKVKTSLSIGIAPFPTEGFKSQIGSKHSELLVHNADVAMYQVKQNNRNGFQFYEASMHEKAERHANIEKYLSGALLKNELEVYCQPILDKQQNVFAAESLLRWRNKDLGLVSPNEFIPIAEESGQIVPIGLFVIEQVCKLLSELSVKNSKFDYITINVSPRQFQQDDFVEQILAFVNKYQVSTNQIKLEITEGLAISNMDDTLSKMNSLIRHGFHFLLDDFGTGYSSLSYVHKLPLDAVKIDKSFISDIAEHVEHQVIANAIIDIAARLNIGCIAEGVENLSDINYLKDKRITGFQGYHYFKPLPLDRFKALFEQQTSATQS